MAEGRKPRLAVEPAAQRTTFNGHPATRWTGDGYRDGWTVAGAAVERITIGSTWLGQHHHRQSQRHRLARFDPGIEPDRR